MSAQRFKASSDRMMAFSNLVHNEKSYFVQSEKEVASCGAANATKQAGVDSDIHKLLGNRPFQKDLEAARRPTGSVLYVSWRKKLAQSLSLAYALYLHILIDPSKASALLNDPYFKPTSGPRQRRLSSGKVALICLQYVTRPESEEERKSASAYSSMLIYARHREVTADAFLLGITGVTMHQARQFVRELRRSGAANKQKVEGSLSISFRGENNVSCKQKYAVPQHMTEQQKSDLFQKVIAFLTSSMVRPVN